MFDNGWIPCVWDGDQEKEGPFYGSRSETLIQVDENGKCVVKEECRGKITYHEGNFINEEPHDHRSIDIVLEYNEN